MDVTNPPQQHAKFANGTAASRSTEALSAKMVIADNHGEPETLESSAKRRWQKIEAYVKIRYVDLLSA